MAEQIQKNGSNVIIMNKAQEGTLAISKKILDICASSHIDAILVHHEAPLLRIIAMYAKCKWPEIRVYDYAHSAAQDLCRGNSGNIGLAVKKRILQYTFQKANKVIAISEYVKTSLVEYLGIQKSHIAVIYNGVDLSKFVQKRKRTGDGPLRLIYIGRIVKEKGIQTTLCALSKMRDIDYCFTIVGDGDYRDMLRELAKELEIENHVVFLGVRTDVPELLADSDVFIHVPICEEGFGIAVVEAMASGLICVCGNRGGIPEIVKNGVNGFLVNDSAELIQVLHRIASNPDSVYYKTIQNEAVKAAKEFSIERFTNTLDRLIATE